MATAVHGVVENQFLKRRVGVRIKIRVMYILLKVLDWYEQQRSAVRGVQMYPKSKETVIAVE